VSAAAFLAKLVAAGITLTWNGDHFHYMTRPRVSIAPYRERLTANKPAQLAALQARGDCGP
jgi:hypothetical protein